MTTNKMYDFVAGDILLYQGESYQVHENLGMTGSAALLPSAGVEPEIMEWSEEFRKIGHAELPGPTPCASGDCVPPPAVNEFRQSNEVQPLRFVDMTKN